MDEENDPEASYRRGYQQGAFDALRAAQSMTGDQLREWADVTLAAWRYRDRIKDRRVSPPRPWLQQKQMAKHF
jgi:hypothetical protein